MRPAGPPRDLRDRVAGLRLLVLDVDGVMTDGGIILMSGAAEAKRFHVQDGVGVTLARAAGWDVAILSGRSSEATRRRAAELKIDLVVEGAGHKGLALAALVEKRQTPFERVAFVGDDLPDIPPMRLVGVPIAVQNARPEVKAAAVHVTPSPGGSGAVRDAVEWLLEIRGDREEVVRRLVEDEAQ